MQFTHNATGCVRPPAFFCQSDSVLASNYTAPGQHLGEKIIERALDDLFAQVLAWGGVITGEHGIGLAKKRWWPDATSSVVRELHCQLKHTLDPNDILNPGKFVESEVKTDPEGQLRG